MSRFDTLIKTLLLLTFERKKIYFSGKNTRDFFPYK